MLFVTVGTQLPFDRLVRAVDEWAGRRQRSDIFAQVGPAQYEPRHFPWKSFITPEEFRRCARDARVLIAHAGMGSILTALELAKPIVVMPRRADLHEHRNDHQLATARRFRALRGVRVALDEQELVQELESLGAADVGERIGPFASPELIAALRQFIDDGCPRTTATGHRQEWSEVN